MARRHIDVISVFVSYLITEKRLSKNSVQAYECDLKNFELFLLEKKTSILKCEKNHLKLYLKRLHDRGLQPGSVSRKVSTLKSFFSFLQKNYAIADLGKALIFPKLVKRLPKYLTQEEIQKLLFISEEDKSPKGIRNHIMLLLLYATGMRISELLHLRFDQIIFTTGFIQVFGKGNKERLVPVPANVLNILRFFLDTIFPLICSDRNDPALNDSLLRNIKYVFVTRYNKKIVPLSRQSYWVYIKKLLKKAGIHKNVSPHTLRHSLASHLLKNGADLRSLQMLLGHENLSTVQIYTHLQDDEQREEYDKSHPRA